MQPTLSANIQQNYVNSYATNTHQQLPRYTPTALPVINDRREASTGIRQVQPPTQSWRGQIVTDTQQQQARYDDNYSQSGVEIIEEPIRYDDVQDETASSSSEEDRQAFPTPPIPLPPALRQIYQSGGPPRPPTPHRFPQPYGFGQPVAHRQRARPLRMKSRKKYRRPVSSKAIAGRRKQRFRPTRIGSRNDEFVDYEHFAMRRDKYTDAFWARHRPRGGIRYSSQSSSYSTKNAVDDEVHFFLSFSLLTVQFLRNLSRFRG